LDYLYNAAVAEMTLGQLEPAQARFLEILKSQPAHFESLYNLAILLLRQGHKTQAKAYLTKALEIRPADPSCLHLLDALNGRGSSAEIASEHAKRLFDQYATYYDQHLLSTLHYRLPVTIDAILKTEDLVNLSCTLDLGCGTGLCGEILRPKTHYLVGVDLSSNMLERAQVKGCYDECIQDDAVNYLQQTSLKFDLIVAADLFPYMGDLSACFEGVKRCLQPEGKFIFSVEEAEKPLWYLQETARYAHHPAYIQVLCDKMKFKILFHEQKSARDQAEGVVKVQLYLVQSSNSV
jgi:predicted TPR repeat methyltransferase